MREPEKKAAKGIKDTILKWMRGVDADMPVIKSPLNEMGGSAWTPEASKQMKNANEAGARAKGYLDGPAGSDNYRVARKSENASRMRAYGANESYKGRKLGAKDNTPSADMGRRLKQESNDFYNSDAGKEFDPLDMRKAMDAWKNQGLGKIGNVPDGDFVETPAQKFYHTKMAKNGNADLIGDHVPNKADYQNMYKKDPYSELNKGTIDRTKLGTNKGGLTDMEKGIITGSAATAAGAATGAAANSYWSRKKEQDRNGNK